MAAFPAAAGEVAAAAQLKTRPEDFIVEEDLGFEPDGVGSHAMLWVEKTGLNTDQVAQSLARHAGRRPVDVGFSGLKDRHALTRQWFSVNLQGGAEPDWAALDSDGLRILRITRQRRKLKRGVHRHNHFTLLLRAFDGSRETVEGRLAEIGRRGMPNYFTEQRFGRQGNNLGQARRMFAEGRGNKKKGYYLSAARAWLFNLVLAERIRQDNWYQALDGDVMNLQGSRSFFHIDSVDEEIRRRLAEGDIHPTGPLWGKGELRTSAKARDLELAALAGFEDFCQGLEAFGLSQERRALRVTVQDLGWKWLPSTAASSTDLQLQFTLPRGSYATALVRELVSTYNGDNAYTDQQ